MNTKKDREGVSIKEIEGFARKNRFMVFCGLSLIVACAFGSWVFFTGLVPLFGALGGMLGVLYPDKMVRFQDKAVVFCSKQEDITQMILGGVAVIISLFLPIVTFFVLGAYGGQAIKKMVDGSISTPAPESKQEEK